MPKLGIHLTKKPLCYKCYYNNAHIREFKNFKSDKNNITFHTIECIYFIRERDAWLGKIIQNTVIRILIRMKV